MIEIKTFQPEFIKPQVDLIWEVTDSWKYAYQTSYETVEKAYSRDGFDPNSRIYAFDGDRLVGFVGSNIAEDAEGKKIGRMRLPIARNDDPEVLKLLMEAIEKYLKEEGVSEITVPAGVGLGNTVQLAEQYGYESQGQSFIRTSVPIENIKVSGNTEGVSPVKDEDISIVEELFMNKMGMPEQQGKSFFDWLIGNAKRKNENQANSASLQLYRENGEVKGFSYLMKSDHSPTKAHSMPVYFDGDGKKIIDRLYSAHFKTLSGVKEVGNYLLTSMSNSEELYKSFGFEYDSSFMFKKYL